MLRAPLEALKEFYAAMMKDYEVPIEAKMEEYSPAETRGQVESFVVEHPFFNKGLDIEVGGKRERELEEFKGNVYRFARAAGMGRNAAKVEVMKATAAWEKKMGLGDGLVWHDEESEFEKVPVLKKAVDYYPKVPAGQVTSEENPTALVISKKESKKRKCESMGEAVSGELEVEDKTREAKRQRRAEKKARNKALLKQRKMEKRANNAAPSSQTAMEAESTDGPRNNASIAAPPTAPPIAQVAQDSEQKQKKKKSKPGPTISPHFITAQSLSVEEEKLRKVAETSDSNKLHKRALKKLRKKERKAREKEEALAASANTHPQRNFLVSAPEEPMDLDVPGASMEPIPQRIEPDPVEAALQEYEVRSPGEEKKKRKKKRNHNKIPKEQPDASTSQLPVPAAQDAKQEDTFQLPGESPQLRAEKRSRVEAYVENLPHASLLTLGNAVPLTELNDTNSQKKAARRDRGGKRATKTVEVGMDALLEQEAKVSHS